MTNNKYLTNQQFLKDLEKRLPDFTDDEFMAFGLLLGKYQQRFMEVIQVKSPQIHSWIQEKQQQLEQEKTDKKIKELKKSLLDKK